MSENISATELELQRLKAATYLYYETFKLADTSNSVEISEVRSFLESTFPIAFLQKVLEEYNSIEQQSSKEHEKKSTYVATVGFDNVGKGVVTNYLRDKYGFEAHPLSDRIKEIALVFGLTPPFNRDTLYNTSKRVKSIFGDAVLLRYAEMLFAKILGAQKLVFDGIRLEGEAQAVRNFANAGVQVALIQVITGESDELSDLKVRFKHALKRGGEKDPKADTEEEFEIFKQKSQREIPGVIAAAKHATHTVINKDGQFHETYQQIDAIMSEFGLYPVSTESLHNSYQIISQP